MGGSAAEVPASSDERPVPGLRASDADRDEVVTRLRDEFVAGRLSQDTFLHRVHVVFQAKRQADLPPVVADLPAAPDRSVAGWLRGTWSRVTGAGSRDRPVPREREGSPGRGTGPRTGSPSRAARSMITGMRLSGRREPLALEFPRGGGGQFSIGRDAGCDLAIADMTVSRRHAQLERTPDGWLLSDLESTNGTRVNGWRVRGKVPVRAGDLVTFGNMDAVFALSGD